MTVIELIEKLKKYPENAQVAVYSEMYEDSDMPSKVQLLSKQEGPYNKGDDVWFLYDLPDEEKIVFIK